MAEVEAITGEARGSSQAFKDLFSGAAGGVAQVLIGEYISIIHHCGRVKWCCAFSCLVLAITLRVELAHALFISSQRRAEQVLIDLRTAIW